MYRNIFSLEGKHIVITGATGLVGSVLAEALSSFGASLTLVARDSARLESLRSALSVSSASEIFTHALDMSSKVEVVNFLSKFSSDNIQVSGVVHCAISRPAQKSLNARNECNEEFLIGNALGSFLILDRFAKLMAKSNGGSVVYMGSIYGSVSPDFSVYEGTDMGTEPSYPFIKGGMGALNKYYANKFGSSGVRFNQIILGGVANNQPAPFVEKFVAKIPLGRMANPSDVVGACVYLLSDASIYVTGSEVTVDGGYLSR